VGHAGGKEKIQEVGKETRMECSDYSVQRKRGLSERNEPEALKAEPDYPKDGEGEERQVQEPP
jgi:hypothetical protein